MQSLLVVTFVTTALLTCATVGLVYGVSSFRLIANLEARLNETATLNSSLSSAILMDTLNVLSYENFTNDITELQIRALELDQQITQKCVEILQLQIMNANQTQEPGAVMSISHTGFDNSVVFAHNQLAYFTTELWDDANYWFPANRSYIYIPSDGRYAIGMQYRHNTDGPASNARTAALTLRYNNETHFQTLQTFYTSTFPFATPGLAKPTIYAYYELELIKGDAATFLSFLVTIQAPGGTPWSRGPHFQVSIQRLGNITGVGITP